MAFTIIKGTLESIPADLNNKARNSYAWGDLAVGDHVIFSVDDAPTARSSATAYGRGTKGSKNKAARAPRAFASQSVTQKDGTKHVEIWRLPDPVVASADGKKQK